MGESMNRFSRFDFPMIPMIRKIKKNNKIVTYDKILINVYSGLNKSLEDKTEIVHADLEFQFLRYYFENKYLNYFKG